MTETTFEEALEALESKVDALSAGHLSLADALRTYEEGVALLRVCGERLEEAELRVTRLSGD
ncbi:MAG TPA: exodeoxyribonuclease VII small subunit [Thermoplasmata archaeon]